jgi:hypothetical protein
MANSEANKGAKYQYYWIKVSTEAQHAEYRSRMLTGDPAATSSGNVTENVIHPPLRKGLVVGSYHPENVIHPPLRHYDVQNVIHPPLRPVAQPSSTSNAAPASASPLTRVTLALDTVSPAYANATGMTVEYREMAEGSSGKDAQEWIQKDGAEWAKGGAFCFLVYIALTQE